LTCNRIIIEAHKIVAPFKYTNKHERRDITLPIDVAGLTLDILADEMLLRPLLGFTTGPLVHADGSITSDGYDADLQVLVVDVPALTVPDQVTKELASAALQRLRHAFRTFPFGDRTIIQENFTIDGKDVVIDVVAQEKTPGDDESAFLVALVTGVCRASLY